MMSWKHSQELTIWLLVWASLSNIWIYGFGMGLLVSCLIYAFPLRRLFTIFKDVEDRSVPDRFFRRFSLPYILLWVIVGIVLTHEFIWLVGLAVWISFNVFIRETSYRFFRQTYDLIEHIFSERGGRKQREIYFVVSSSFTAFATVTGIMGHLTASQIVDLMGFAGNFSLILITILLAIQAVIPGINIWSTGQNPRRRLREIRTMLRANRGLGGFMVAFFILFLLSNSMRWLLQSSDFGSTHIASLDIQFMTAKTGNIFDVVLGSEFSAEVTLVVVFTLMLVVCISLLIYCMTLLYYMFSTASLFLAPMLDTVLSTPVIVESISNSLSLENCEKKNVESDIIQTLTACTKLNGCIIDQLVSVDSLVPERPVRLTIHFHTDYPD